MKFKELNQDSSTEHGQPGTQTQHRGAPFRRHSVIAFIALLCLLGLPASLTAQLSTTATIRGTVVDSAGALVPAADVTVTNLQTGTQNKVTSNAAGQFVLTGLPVGRYRVQVNKQGFSSFTEDGLQLDATTVVPVQATLKPGSVESAVTVSASQVLVETDSSELSGQITGKQAQSIPLNGRNYQSLIGLLPGSVNMAAGQTMGSGGRQTNNTISLNGLGIAGTFYTLDGIWNENTGNMGQTTVTPNPDTIQEIRVLQDNYNAKYSLMGSSVVLVDTKSGSNAFHGTGFEYLRNTSLDARNAFSPARTALQENTFGYTVGGPVLLPKLYNGRDHKTFFFWSQQWVREKTPNNILSNVPTADMRQGLFTTSIKDPQTGLPFAQNSAGQYVIPGNEINPSSVAFLNALYPLPNYTGSSAFNYLNASPTITRQRDDEIKVDHNFNENWRLTGEYLDERQNLTLPDVSGMVLNSSHENPVTQNQLAQVQLNTVLTPTLVNQVSMAMNNYVLYLTVQGTTQLSQVPGFQEVLPFHGQNANLLPMVSFSGGWAQGGLPASRPLYHAGDLEDTIGDDVSWTSGNHLVQTGFNLVFGTKRQNTVTASNGAWSFTGQSTGNPIADFLLGDPASFTQASDERRNYAQYRIFSPYVDDSWKVTPRLTVNFGARLSYMPVPHDQPGFVTLFNPATYNSQAAPIVNANGTITPTPGYDPLNGLHETNGRNGVPLNFNTQAPNWYLLPNVGFAWDVFGDGRTALRGGYGMTVTRTPFQECDLNCALNPPNLTSLTLNKPSFPNPVGTGSAAPLSTPTLNTQDPHLQAAQVQSYSLSLQHQFGGNWLVTVAGAGDVAHHLSGGRNLNQPLPVTIGGVQYDFDPGLNKGNYTYLNAPYPGYAAITSTVSNFDANWNAFEATVRHSMENQLFLTASYTWSHALSDARGTSQFQGGSSQQNAYNNRAEYGNSNINAPQALTLSYVWNLHWFASQQGLRGLALGGWNLAGTTTMQTGTSLDLGLSIKNAGLAKRPSLVSGQPFQGPQTVAEWFNTAAFTAPAAGFFGNASTGSILSPGLQNWDMSLYKTFHLGESRSIDLRGEIFNVWNHTNLHGVGTSFGSSSFGHVTSALDPRIAQLSLRVAF